MAWNQPDDNEGKRVPRPEAAVRRWPATLQRALRRWFSAPGSRRARRSLTLGSVLLLLLAWGGSGLVQVPPGCKALVLRFGQPLTVLDPGTALRAPWPVERVIVVNTAERTLSLRTHVLSADLVPADVNVTLRYQVQDVPGFLQNLADPVGVLDGLAERLAREAAAGTSFEALLADTPAPEALAAARTELRLQLQRLGMGVSVTDATVGEVQVPVALAAEVGALKAAQTATDMRREEAQRYAESLKAPLAADRDRLLREADTYRADTIATAESEAARFEAVLPAYKEAPELWRRRMYVETVESVLTRARKVIVDTKVGNGFYLPLEKVLQEAVRNSGNAPAAGTATSAAAAPEAGSDADARSRDRVER